MEKIHQNWVHRAVQEIVRECAVVVGHIEATQGEDFGRVGRAGRYMDDAGRNVGGSVRGIRQIHEGRRKGHNWRDCVEYREVMVEVDRAWRG